MGVPSNPKVQQIFHRLLGTLRGHYSFRHQAPQNLSYLQVDKMWSMQRLLPQIDSLFDLLTVRRLQ